MLGGGWEVEVFPGQEECARLVEWGLGWVWGGPTLRRPCLHLGRRPEGCEPLCPRLTPHHPVGWLSLLLPEPSEIHRVSRSREPVFWRRRGSSVGVTLVLGAPGAWPWSSTQRPAGGTQTLSTLRRGCQSNNVAGCLKMASLIIVSGLKEPYRLRDLHLRGRAVHLE